MKQIAIGRRGVVVTAVTVASLALAGGIAYATIPGPGNVFSACVLKDVGTIRLIDKSLPATNLMSRCTVKETEVSWNQRGEPGIQGVPGPAGKDGPPGKNGDTGRDGTDGVGVSSAAEPPGMNCPDGGSRFTAANGTTYACNGARGGPGSGGTVFGSTVVLNADPPVTVYDNPAFGHIEVGCVAGGGANPIQPQVAFWNDTSQTLSVNMLTAAARTVAPGGRIFLIEDATSWIGPEASTLPGAERGNDPNAVSVTRPLAKVDVISRVPFQVAVLGVGAVPGCAYTVAVTAVP